MTTSKNILRFVSPVVGAVLLNAAACDPQSKVRAAAVETDVGELNQPLINTEKCLKDGTNQCFPYANNKASDLEAAWIDWRDRHVKVSSTVAGGKKIWKSDPTSGISNTVVSEGMSYGLKLSVLFDEQDLFDALWKFARAKSVARGADKVGLMDWCYNENETSLCVSGGSASDATIDFAQALMFANKKVTTGAWAASSTYGNYQAEAQAVLNAMYTYETGPDLDSALNNCTTGCTYRVFKSGDSWANECLNISYYDPGTLKVANAFEGGTRWTKVIDYMYKNLDDNQATGGNCSKLVSNWNVRSGAPSTCGGDGNSHAWDAIRTEWRIAVDKVWYNDARAVENVNQFSSFWKGVGVKNIKMKYELNGTYGFDTHNVLFTACGSAAVYAGSSATALSGCGQATGVGSTAAQALDETLLTKELDPTYMYYNNSWRLFSLMLQTGNYPNLWTHLTGGTPPVASCTDVVKNGYETDVDCGGSGACSRCANGKVCTAGSDCSSTYCASGVCAAVPSTYTGSGSIGWEQWTGLSTVALAISDIPLANTPNATGTFTTGTMTWNPTSPNVDGYGVRIRGLLTAPSTGSYTFYIAGDDNVDLYVGTNDQASSKTKVAYHTSWSAQTDWLKFPTQKSAAITLTGGTKYYIEAVMKEGGGGDGMNVGWTTPSNATIAAIPVTQLSPFTAGPTNVAPTVSITSPANNSSSATSTAVTIAATAADSDGQVAKVEFFNGATLLGADTTSPYTWSWVTPSTAQAVTLTAKATDNGSKVTTSTGVVVNVTAGGTCSLTTATYETESAGVVKSTGGADGSTGWNLWSNGTATANHGFSATSTKITVQAKGSIAAGVWPNMVVKVNGVQIGTATVNSTAYTAYPFTFTATAATQQVLVEFTNDLNSGGEDRNLFVDKWTIGCP